MRTSSYAMATCSRLWRQLQARPSRGVAESSRHLARGTPPSHQETIRISIRMAPSHQETIRISIRMATRKIVTNMLVDSKPQHHPTPVRSPARASPPGCETFRARARTLATPTKTAHAPPLLRTQRRGRGRLRQCLPSGPWVATSSL
jgi:hypothetical protein